MTDYPLHLDPFERVHLGRHGAFVHRVNRKHVERSVAIIRTRLEDVRPAGRVTVLELAA